MTILINKGNIKDVDQMTAIDRICFPKQICYSQDVFQEILSQKAIYSQVARTNIQMGETIAGFAIMEEVAGRAKYGHLITIDVHPDFREKGIGSKLLDKMHRRVKKKKLEKMILEVYTYNTRAFQFYCAHGYQEITILNDYYGLGKDGCLMMKTLI